MCSSWTHPTRPPRNSSGLEVVAQTRQVVETAAVGDAAAAVAALEGTPVLCAHRQGPFGVGRDDQIAAWTEHLIARRAAGDPWYMGRPLLVTANDYTADLYNGDTGIVVDAGHGQVQAVFAHGVRFSCAIRCLVWTR